MSRPVRRHPGAFYLWTRCVDRQEFRLRPGQSFEQTVGLLIADAAQEHGVLVAQLVIMSNHLHAVLWDPRGVVSEFAQQALASIGRMVNKAHKRGGHFWDRHDGNELMEIGDLDALIHYVAYCYLNPTRAELVAHPSAWPGINTDPADVSTGGARARRGSSSATTASSVPTVRSPAAPSFASSSRRASTPRPSGPASSRR